MSNLPDNGRIQVAVITGGHAFHVPGLHALFHSLDGVDWYAQSLENFVMDVARVRTAYDVLLFYNMPRETPEAGSRTEQILQEMTATGQGIFLLHHAILAHLEWPFWSRLAGISDRRFDYYHAQQLAIQIADPAHPITAGLQGWEMVDETYEMADCGPDSRVLLRVEHPQSMRTIAWTRQVDAARVFCFQSGHDNRAYDHAGFRAVVQRGVEWCAGRL